MRDVEREEKGEGWTHGRRQHLPLSTTTPFLNGGDESTRMASRTASSNLNNISWSNKPGICIHPLKIWLSHSLRALTRPTSWSYRSTERKSLQHQHLRCCWREEEERGMANQPESISSSWVSSLERSVMGKGSSGVVCFAAWGDTAMVWPVWSGTACLNNYRSSNSLYFCCSLTINDS